MKRKTIALLLALMMCLSLLSACGGNDTADTSDPTSSDSTSDTTGQQPDETEKQPSQEPEQTEPEESKKPTQEPAKEADSPTVAFLSLLQDEYKNGGCLWGHSAKHTCVNTSAVRVFADGKDIFIRPDTSNKNTYRYNTATKELEQFAFAVEERENTYVLMYVDGLFYSYDSTNKKISAYDKTGARVYSAELGGDWSSLSDSNYFAFFEKGFVFPARIRLPDMTTYSSVYTTFSYDLKEQHIIPWPEKEVAHGIKEPIVSFKGLFSVDGNAYAYTSDTVYKLNTDTWEWDTVDYPNRMTGTNYYEFYGRYVYTSEGIFDRLTGEKVFTFDGQYPVPKKVDWQKYAAHLGVYVNQSNQLVDLHLFGISEKWALPQKFSDYVILDNTYLVYWDSYGYFLWNALEGTEETIRLFNN